MARIASHTPITPTATVVNHAEHRLSFKELVTAHPEYGQDLVSVRLVIPGELGGRFGHYLSTQKIPKGRGYSAAIILGLDYLESRETVKQNTDLTDIVFSGQLPEDTEDIVHLAMRGCVVDCRPDTIIGLSNDKIHIPSFLRDRLGTIASNIGTSLINLASVALLVGAAPYLSVRVQKLASKTVDDLEAKLTNHNCLIRGVVGQFIE